jgi:hypothetical protein
VVREDADNDIDRLVGVHTVGVTDPPIETAAIRNHPTQCVQRERDQPTVRPRDPSISGSTHNLAWDDIVADPEILNVAWRPGITLVELLRVYLLGWYARLVVRA